MKKIKARILCFGQFLKWMCMYPTPPIENWQDMNTCYYFSTDEECIKQQEELGKLFRKGEDV